MPDDIFAPYLVVSHTPFPTTSHPHLLSVKLHIQDVLANLTRIRHYVLAGLPSHDIELSVRHAKSVIHNATQWMTHSKCTLSNASPEVSTALTSACSTLLSLDMACTPLSVDTDISLVESWLTSVAHLDLASEMAVFAVTALR